MKLRYSKTSPYVRKVMMVAMETGLAAGITLEPTDAWSPGTSLPQDNPIGKVPTLVLDDGTALYDSPVICEYLDGLHDGPKLFPASGQARWTALRLQALADGICDAAALGRLESMRPEGERSPSWMARQRMVLVRGCDALEAETGTLAGPTTIGTLAAMAALGYLDFRCGDLGWREGRPRLAAWFEEVSARPSFRDTHPA